MSPGLPLYRGPAPGLDLSTERRNFVRTSSICSTSSATRAARITASGLKTRTGHSTGFHQCHLRFYLTISSERMRCPDPPPPRRASSFSTFLSTFSMIDLTRRRLLAWGGNPAALGMLSGCESLYESASLRSPVYDTSAADRASDSAAAVEPPNGGPRPALPLLFDDIERRTFDFFWVNGNPANGMVPDRYPSSSPASIAAIGMALTAYVIGVDRGFITREQARTRTLATVRFFRNAPQGSQRLGMTGLQGILLPLPRHEDRSPRRAQRVVHGRHGAVDRRHAVTHRPTSMASIPTRRRSGPRSTPSTGASTGSGRRCGAITSAWAGNRSRLSSRTTGRATTRRCSWCCSRSVRPATPSAPRPGRPGRTATRGPGAASWATST